MEVNDALIERLSLLARLEFNETEKLEIRQDLQRMIQFVEKLNELDTDGVEPLIHMSQNQDMLREDRAMAGLDRTEAFLNAPLQDGNFFLVPQVIKK